MEQQYFPSVVQALAGADFTVYAYFSDGSIKHYDVKPLIRQGGVFEKLADEATFQSALTVLNDTVAWDLTGKYDPTKCIDIDPFEVYEGESVSDPMEIGA